MPRFLSLWLDYGADVVKLQQRHHQTPNVRRGIEQKSVEANMLDTFTEVQKVNLLK